MFRIKNGIYTYVLSPSKHKKFTNLRSKFSEVRRREFLQIREKSIPMTRVFRQLPMCACHVYCHFFRFCFQNNELKSATFSSILNSPTSIFSFVIMCFQIEKCPCKHMIKNLKNC